MQATPELPSPDRIFQVLQDAASQDYVVAQAASAQLDVFRTIPGVFYMVQMAANERNLPLDVRKMAIFQFKNVVPQQWRRAALYPENVKQDIRSGMFRFLDEPDDIIAQTNAIAMAKIARIDFPRAWPDVGSQLLEVIGTNSQAIYINSNTDPRALLVLRRALGALNQIIKELTPAKIPLLASAVLGLVHQVQEALLPIYGYATATFSNNLSPETLASDDKLNHIRIAHFTFKCIVKCITFMWHRTRVKGFEVAEPVVKGFFGTAVTHFIALSTLRSSLFQANLSQNLIQSPTQSYLSRHVRLYGKYFRKTQVYSPQQFVRLPHCRELVLHYWERVVAASGAPPTTIQDSDNAMYPIRFLTQALSIFKDALAQWSPIRQPDNQEVLPREFVEGAIDLIVNRLLLLDEQDLEKWSEEPEEWINIEEGDSDAWEYGVRPCAERVLMTLATQYGDYVEPMIRTYLQRVREHPATDLPSIIKQEAVYCAVGRCAHRLKDIDFDSWISQSLAQEALDPNPIYRIIKRRIAWLFGRWYAERSLSQSREKVYEILVHLISAQGEGSDLAIRLTAATALENCINSVNFEIPVFHPFITPSLSALLQLVADTESQDAKRRVIRSINTLIDNVKEAIVPSLGDIIGPVTQLWQHPEVDIPLRGELISTASSLIKASKENSAPLAPIAAILIRDCLSPILSVQMEDDAINLWLVTLRNSVPNPNPTVPDIFELLPTSIHILNTNLDAVSGACQLIESYLLLDATRVLQLQALPLHQAYLQVYKTAITADVKTVLGTACMMVQLSVDGRLWAEAMHTSGFFAHILSAVIEDRTKNDNTLVLVEFDNIVDAPRRKLVALATAELLATGNKIAVERLATSEALNIWLDVLGELKEALEQRPGEDDQDSPLILYWKQQDEYVLPDKLEDAAETLEFGRRQDLFKRDPVRNIPLKEFIQQKMQQAQAVAGVEFQAALSKVDSATIASIQKQLS
ncbi:SubName: Full=Uncharacterized protein {ECO:0000313/EMBL:CCA73991.1} [Serendipita indica DSM 11827]|uniref:Importin N-terminal domain-containing protein n=1 Tax=Serendipita indica (strain DSM 11827) TaxID=1109443 RepID=G4TRP8_SERID|nr:SubName: Full=Uncharacterized protein {ECO:0000313/EMBL:CCA73991.1} [Serendipita indica DSM 11827]CCA73991.1 hypothetical protein PIIN_07945 [Serendipita indica DSM 11827]